MTADERAGEAGDDAREALVSLALHLAELAGRCPRLARVTLNPIMLAGDDTVTVDVEVVLRHPEKDGRPDVRRL